MSESTPATGPDFAQGIPRDEIADGGVLLGHVDGEAALLIRRGEEIFAVSAVCGHYGGPLAEGIVCGDEVRCPWHHARFDLRTGEVAGPPSPRGIPTWTVIREGDRVRTGSRREPPALGPGAAGPDAAGPDAAGPHAARPDAARPDTAGPQTRDATARHAHGHGSPGVPSSVVIVGAGAAGDAAAAALRHEGYSGPITLIGRDAEPVPVDRPNLSKDFLAGKAPEEWLAVRGAEFYAAQQIEIVSGADVRRLEPRLHRLTLAGGRTLEYGALLLATGAEPIRLDLPGASLPHVFTLRTLADARAIVERAEASRTAVVIGASFIGLEVAASLRERGVEVHVVAPEARPLERILGSEVGDFVRSIHEEHGVVFHLGRRPAAITAEAVTLDDGARIGAGLVVMGVGVRPRTELADEAGLAVERGVRVDAYLRASAPDVFAAGDIARFPVEGGSQRIEHWVVAQQQGRCAARNILGRNEPYRAVPFFWSQHYDVPISVVGHAEKWDRIQVAGSLAGRDALVAFRADEHIAAVASVYRDRDSLRAEEALARGDQAALEALLLAAAAKV